MRRLLALAFLVFTVAILACPARPQTTGTALSLQARWDNNTNVQGTVTLSKVNVSGPNTVVATETLSRGRTSVTVPLAANSLYNVSLVSSSGTQLASFPITTALINPSNLSSAEIQMVVHTSNNTLASARIQVSLSF
jgi:hypothetical protein